MAAFVPDMMNTQGLDTSYLSTQFNMDDLTFQLQDPLSLKMDLLPDFMDPFEDLSFHDEHDMSFSGASSQSISPQLGARHIMPQLPELPGVTPVFNPHLEPISPTSSVQSLPSTTRKESVDDDHRAERRRAQNRAAQRAYRQRKDQSLKHREKEVESLKDELDKAQRLNKTLCKVVALLRERLKEPADVEEDC